VNRTDREALMSLQAGIRTFILENWLFTTDVTLLDDDESLLDKGVLDSTAILELLQFLEEEHGINVELEELLPENLDSVNRIVEFARRKKVA
jgi:acyl carrier protein